MIAETQLALIDRLEAQLATITNPADAAQLTRDFQALRVAAGNRTDANKALVLYGKAARRAGELLTDIPRSAGGRPEKNSLHGVTSFQQALADCAIDVATAHRWQALARIDRDTFESWCERLEAGEVDGLKGLLKLVAPPARSRSPIVLADCAPRTRLLVGDVRQCLASLESDSVQCVVTSPPYWGLRSYSTTPQVWGQPCCEHPHEWSAPLLAGESYAAGGRRRWQHVGGRVGMEAADWDEQPQQGRFCEHEHAWAFDHAPAASGGRSEKQLSNAGSWVETSLVGSCSCGAWLGELGTEPTPELYVEHVVEVMRGVRRVLRPDGVLWLNLDSSYAGSGRGPTGYNGIGDQLERQGFDPSSHPLSTLQGGRATLHAQQPGRGAAGYKPKDLVLTPFLVAEALRRDGWYLRSVNAWCKRAPMPESVTDRPTSAWEPVFLLAKSERYYWDADAVRDPDTGHNLWDYWLVGPEPFPDAHFATFPTAIPETCILASTRPGDQVLDPFAGAGTTLLVAGRLGRDSVGIELNESYARMAVERIEAEGVNVEVAVA
jgi:site-specific DNA-methyltransferase (cytosine-N4-specific)